MANCRRVQIVLVKPHYNCHCSKVVLLFLLEQVNVPKLKKYIIHLKRLFLSETLYLLALIFIAQMKCIYTYASKNMASYSTDLAIARYPQLLGGFRIKLQKHLLRPSQGERAYIRVNKGGLDLSKEVL